LFGSASLSRAIRNSLMDGFAIRKGVRILATFLAVVAGLSASTIKGSKHDLSSNSTPDSTQVCIWCHTPHRANNTLGPANVPLWNRYVDTSKNFMVYTGSTMDTQPGNPMQSGSAACLACHDGTIAYAPAYGQNGMDKMGVINGPGLHENAITENCTRCHVSIYSRQVKDTLKFGMDLRGMHPISMTYPTPAQDPAFLPPADAKSGWNDVKLFNGKVECASCHAVHDPTISPFLRKSNDRSALCLTCHIK